MKFLKRKSIEEKLAKAVERDLGQGWLRGQPSLVVTGISMSEGRVTVDLEDRERWVDQHLRTHEITTTK